MTPAPPTDFDLDFDPPETAAIAWLAQAGAYVVTNGGGYHQHVVRLVERHGSDRVIAAMEGAKRAGAGDARSLIFGAANALDPIPNGKATAGLAPPQPLRYVPPGHDRASWDGCLKDPWHDGTCTPPPPDPPQPVP